MYASFGLPEDVMERMMDLAEAKHQEDLKAKNTEKALKLETLLKDERNGVVVANSMIEKIADPVLRYSALAELQREEKAAKKKDEIQAVNIALSLNGARCLWKPKGKPCKRAGEDRYDGCCKQCHQSLNRLSNLPEEMRLAEKLRRKVEGTLKRNRETEERKKALEEKIAARKQKKHLKMGSLQVLQQPNQQQQQLSACVDCLLAVEATDANFCKDCGLYAHSHCRDAHNKKAHPFASFSPSFVAAAARDLIFSQIPMDNNNNLALALVPYNNNNNNSKLQSTPRITEPVSEEVDGVDLTRLNVADVHEEQLQQEQERFDDENDPDYREGDEELELLVGDGNGNVVRADGDGGDGNVPMDVDDDDSFVVPDNAPIESSNNNDNVLAGGHIAKCVSCFEDADKSNAQRCRGCGEVVHHYSECIRAHVCHKKK